MMCMCCPVKLQRAAREEHHGVNCCSGWPKLINKFAFNTHHTNFKADF